MTASLAPDFAKRIQSDRYFVDATLSLLREGYRFIPNRCERLQTDIFRTRLMLRNVVCMRGPSAARLFYGNENLTRVGAMPQTVLRLLQDKGSVQQLDGDAHRHRKAMFVRMLMRNTDGIGGLVALFRETWLRHLVRWQGRQDIVLLTEVGQVLAETAIRWSGIPFDRMDFERDGKVLAEMIEGAGHFGPRTLAALFRRSGLEKRLEMLVRDVREGPAKISESTPLHTIAFHRGLDGSLMSARVAAIELLNILRPIVAINRFVVFAAMTLHEQNDWCRLLEAGNDEFLDDFVEEVRRISPFFPFVGAVAKNSFEFESFEFPRGQWLLFDLYGTNHDPRLHPHPDRFKAYRQLSWRDQNNSFVPQGAGDAETTHRCPGEYCTVEIMKEAVKLLCQAMTYEVPPQNLSISMRSIPSAPASGFRIDNIKMKVKAG
jgi:fatty-acid peroxygenase